MARCPCRSSGWLSTTSRARPARTAAWPGRAGCERPRRPAPDRRRRELALARRRSGRPGEVGLRHAGLSLVLDAEGVDAGALGLRHRQIRSDGVEHAGEAHGLVVLDAEGHDVLDLEVDRVADADAVAVPVVLDRDRSPPDG